MLHAPGFGGLPFSPGAFPVTPKSAPPTARSRVTATATTLTEERYTVEAALVDHVKQLDRVLQQRERTGSLSAQVEAQCLAADEQGRHEAGPEPVPSPPHQQQQVIQHAVVLVPPSPRPAAQAPPPPSSKVERRSSSSKGSLASLASLKGSGKGMGRVDPTAAYLMEDIDDSTAEDLLWERGNTEGSFLVRSVGQDHFYIHVVHRGRTRSIPLQCTDQDWLLANSVHVMCPTLHDVVQLLSKPGDLNVLLTGAPEPTLGLPHTAVPTRASTRRKSSSGSSASGGSNSSSKRNPKQ
jgi:hypothetical protein